MCVSVCAHAHVQMCPLLPIICKGWGRGLTLSLLCVTCCSPGRGINSDKLSACDWQRIGMHWPREEWELTLPPFAAL